MTTETNGIHHGRVAFSPTPPRELADNWWLEFSTGSAALERRMLPGTAAAPQLFACWRKLWPSNGQHRRQETGGLPGPWPSPAAVWRRRYARKSCPTCCGDMGGALIWQAPDRASGGCRAGLLLEPHTCICAGHGPGWGPTGRICWLAPTGHPFSRPWKQRWGEDLLWHLEGVRPNQGSRRAGALPLVALARAQSPCRADRLRSTKNGGPAVQPRLSTSRNAVRCGSRPTTGGQTKTIAMTRPGTLTRASYGLGVSGKR